ncbi:MAG: putative hydroxymethylpyrimidine transporter CytX [Bacillota bacterium]|jgi:putative hydroxymethylpyrimidine transporter CytX
MSTQQKQMVGKTEGHNRVSTISQMLIWFGASISIAEILAGTLMAPLGFQQGLLAIILGHAIGFGALLMTGLIGAKSRLSASQSVSISFGRYGSVAFSLVNTLQLFGWSAIVLLAGSSVLNGITMEFLGFDNRVFWCVIIGAVICVWILIGMRNLEKVNRFVISALFIFAIILGLSVFGGAAQVVPTSGGISFGAAVELNTAMALSWLPLISDYTCKLKKPISGTVATVASYIGGSFIMFSVGLGAAIYAGTSEIYGILMTAGFGIGTALVVLFSTAATTFLDAYSIGVNANNLNRKIPQKVAGVIACAIGVVLAILVQVDQYEGFLYLIGSVFAPLFAILLMDYYVLGKKTVDPKCMINWQNLIIWAVGFVIYRLLMSYNSFIGITIPVMLIIAAICWVVYKIRQKKGRDPSLSE